MASKNYKNFQTGLLVHPDTTTIEGGGVFSKRGGVGVPTWSQKGHELGETALYEAIPTDIKTWGNWLISALFGM